MVDPLIIGIAGGTGSGKTRFTKELIKRSNMDHVVYISQDSYYKNLKHLSYEQRCQINFDSPESIDFESLRTDIKSLASFNEISAPVYDFKTHLRLESRKKVRPKPIIIIEGIFSLYDIEIRKLTDIKVFVDTPADIRILRRVKRDMIKRKRSIESITNQYISTVRPMHDQFVEPTKEFADIIVPNGGKNKIALNVINSQLLPIMKEKIKNVNT